MNKCPAMSTSRTSSTPSSSLRPRAGRLISGLSDDGDSNGNLTVAASTSSTPGSRSQSQSRTGSPLPSNQSSRASSTIGQQRRNDITSHPRPNSVATSSTKFANPSFGSLWGTSWNAIQGFANDFLGEQASYQGPTRQRKNSVSGNARLSSKPIKSSWGPSSQQSPATSSIATGSREERETLVRAQKRKDLLSGAASSYPDALGKFKRRTSDEGVSSSAPPGANEDRDALVYLHHVQPNDTVAGITIKYSCSANILRKTNRMWANDTVQSRKVLTLPVDACGVKGRPISEHEADLLNEPEGKEKGDVEDTSDLPTPKMNGTARHHRNESASSNLSEVPPPSTKSSATDAEPPWTHDSWVMLPNHTKPTEIARLPRRTLGYFPPARRKSQSYSDLDTPSASLDLNRQTYFDSLSATTTTTTNSFPSLSPLRTDSITSTSSSAPQRPRRPRRFSNATNGYFPSYLSGPGGVGTMAKNVRSPGPAQDGLNKLFASRLPNVAPPPNQQSLYMPDVPLYSDDVAGLSPGGAASPFAYTGSGAVSGSLTPTQSGQLGVNLENVGAAVEGWIRKMATQAKSALENNGGADSPGGALGARGRGGEMGVPTGVGGPSGVGDLIEMADAFEIGADEDGEAEEESRGRKGEDAGAGGSGASFGTGARSRGKSAKAD